MKIYTRILTSLAALMTVATVASCDLTETMQVDADKAMIFSSEPGLEAFSYSLYNMLPTTKSIFKQESGKCDYASCSVMNDFFIDGAYNAESSTSWSWSNLHTINYFIDGLNSELCTVDAATRNHFLGIGRWFRAYFYYDKLKTYGGVPWFDHEIQNYERDYMYKERDSRDVIIENIIADLNFAYDHIRTTSSVGNSLISKYAAASLKSRVCLFEASFRKYHGVSGDKYTAEDLYNETIAAANLVITSGKFKLNTNAGSKGAYRELFLNESPNTDESILAICASADAGIYGEANWYFNSASYGNRICAVRPFVNTFLMKDGTPFTAKENYALIEYKDEFANRDLRLAQILRGPGYQMDGKNMVPDIKTNVAMTGYHVIKFSLDSKSYDNGAYNPSSMPMIRYAEVLLNYAEARAELGEINDRDWVNTIAALRSRAGVNAGTTLPTELDTYMKDTFYPDVTDPVIMEIRRERAIELYLEGFRMDDLRRWKSGRLFEDLAWTGIHIAELDAPIDINGDGTNDYYFSTSAVDSKSAHKDIWIQVDIEPDGLWAVKNAAGGYDLEHKTVGGRKWYEDDRQYLYPIPAKVVRDYAAEGYKITQNPKW